MQTFLIFSINIRCICITSVLGLIPPAFKNFYFLIVFIILAVSTEVQILLTALELGSWVIVAIAFGGVWEVVVSLFICVILLVASLFGAFTIGNSLYMLSHTAHTKFGK